MENKHYNAVARGLHWGIAALIFFQLALGWRMADMPKGPGAFTLFQLHKSIGFSILALALLRLLWRLTHRAPPLPDAMPRWEQVFARLGHAGLYFMLFALPLTGWILVSASKIQIPTLLFGAIPVPHLPFIAHLPPEARGVWREFGEEAHEALVALTVLLVLGHAGAALKHQLIDKDEVVSHMLPDLESGVNAPRLWFVLIVIAMVGLAGSFWPSVPEAKEAPAAPPVEAPAPQLQPASEPTPAPAVPAEPKPVAVESPAAVAAAPAAARAVAWRIAPESTLGFTTSWSGEPVKGSFKQWQGEIRFSPDALSDSSLKVKIDLASVSTGDAQRDEALPGEDWFDAGHFPQAQFTASRFTAKGGDRYRADGALTLRGKTAPVSLDFTLKVDGDQAHAEGQAQLDRTVFGVGQGDWSATDQIPARVTVQFRISARKAG